MVETNGTRLMLRRTLIPWKFEETIREALDYARHNGINEIIWKIDTEEFSHGLPTPELIRTYLPWLSSSRELLAAEGIAMSINPWASLNHGDRGRDMTGVFPDMHWFTDSRGVACKSTACPLCPRWQEYFREIYRLYASTRPAILWVEDDFRMQFHQPAAVGCFCDLHLRTFSERTGREWPREELVRAILAPGQPDPARREWLDFLSEHNVEFAASLERAVHGISPETRIGLMHGMPCGFSFEGRRWKALTRAFSGPLEVVTRPGMGNYSEGRPTSILDGINSVRQTAAMLGPDARLCPELENWNYSEFNKSARYTFLQLAASFMTGAREITLNLHDHLGTPVAENPSYGQMLRANRAFFDGIADSFGTEGAREHGVRLIHHDDESRAKHLAPGSDFPDLLTYEQEWGFALQLSGVPITYREAPVTAVTGQTVRALAPSAVEKLLSGGLLLDGSAAWALLELGYGELIGIARAAWRNKNDQPLSAELLADGEFGGGPQVFTSLTGICGNDLFLDIKPRPGAREISALVDPDRTRRFAGMLLAENSLGGRIAIHPFDLSSRVTFNFLSWARKRQLHAIARWINRGRTLVSVVNLPLVAPIVKEYDDRVMIGLINLGLDGHPETRLSVPEDLAGREISALCRDGQWRPAPVAARRPAGQACLRLTTAIAGLDVLILNIRKGDR